MTPEESWSFEFEPAPGAYEALRDAFFNTSRGFGGQSRSYFYTAPPPPPPRIVTVKMDILGHLADVPLFESEYEELLKRAQTYNEEMKRRAAEDLAQKMKLETPRQRLRVIAQVKLGVEMSDEVLVRNAKRKAHPDTGGSNALFDEVRLLAEAIDIRF